MPRKLRSKLNRARRSWTVWFSAAVPVVLASAEALRDNLGSLDEYLSGWGKVAAAVAVSAVVAALRLRNSGDGEGA